jgi:hypothetical protein
MRERHAAGRDRDHWRRIHDEMAGIAPTPADLALRAYVAAYGCCPG